MQTAILTVPAMHTEAIAVEVAKALESVAGVERIHVTLAQSRVRVGFDETLASPVQLRSALQSAGYIVDDTAAGGGCCGGCGGSGH